MIKIAFVGGSCDSIAGYPHLIASQMDSRFKVIAGVFSTNEEINNATLQQYNVNKIYEDYKELIQHEKDNLDAVVVLAPTPLHTQIVYDLLKEDIPVICEKPLTNSIDDVEKIENIYDKNKHFLVVTNNYSGYPMVRELQEKIKENLLGKILHIRLKMPQESFLRPPKSIKYPQKWRLKDDFIPMISLDLGAHLHHLAYFLLQEEPAQVFATHNSFSKYNVVDDVNMLLEYDSGIKGNFWMSKTSLGNRNGLTIEVYGEKASATWVQETPEVLQINYNNGHKSIFDRSSDNQSVANPLFNRMTPGHPSGFIEAFANLYNDIADSFEDFQNNKNYTNKYVYGFEHAKNGLILLNNASVSNQQKQWIKI